MADGFKILAFADPLKEVCATLYNLHLDVFSDPELKEKVLESWGKSPRQLVQFTGTDLVRKHLGDDFWVKRLRTRLEKDCTTTVTSGVRFKTRPSWYELGVVSLSKVLPQTSKEPTARLTHLRDRTEGG